MQSNDAVTIFTITLQGSGAACRRPATTKCVHSCRIRAGPFSSPKGEEGFWYFGGIDDPATRGFPDNFPELIKDRQGISYVHDEAVIDRFVLWLKSYGQSGLIGNPRDPVDFRPERFLVEIDPMPKWIAIGDDSPGAVGNKSSGSCRPRVSSKSCQVLKNSAGKRCS